ncbi:MAG: ABC transporter substrate-binding protein [Pseudomonadota bacterium]|nr:ABC transporter substrate-binding protein [Pseudomonadota bacterium]
MSGITRRDVLKAGAALAAGGLLLRPGRAAAQELRFTPESGAELKVLRWQAFVPDDEEVWAANTRKFTEASGVPVTLESIPWPDIRPRALAAARDSQGPDIILGWLDDPHQFPDQLLPVSDIADYLAEKYGDWYDTCKRYGTHQGQWIALPLGALGTCIVYRDSHVKAAGFEEFPGDTDGFLRLCQTLARNGHPPGLVLGPAVGDATVWTHWCLWAFGGKLVDLGGLTVINSRQTEQALEYARELYQTFPPGTTDWLDPDNNRAFLAGEISLTANGVSIYNAAKKDPALKDLAGDIRHANLPVGPVGTPTELFLLTQAMIYGYTRFPNAAKEYLRFMWEQEQYGPWLTAAGGSVTQPLHAYEDNPLWRQDPEITPYRDCTARMLWNGYAGPLGAASARALADNIVVEMFAQAASGKLTPQQAMERAGQQAGRYYRV